MVRRLGLLLSALSILVIVLMPGFAHASATTTAATIRLTVDAVDARANCSAPGGHPRQPRPAYALLPEVDPR
jgi:hypothetical protein